MANPYERFEGTPLWKSLDKGIDNLAKNNDIEETARREYIVGYLCQLIDEAKWRTRNEKSN
ncbi:hypothetical protein B0H99_103174 [Planomicrobium soli]|uniref:Uncharacterized protein n=1 Tax=Planomicrobium soli TaxID=1176648 RepID=A0A2P8H4B6_9BACL|nr:hypothetical protein [Planomicrobium soli]PSL41040.1 hypothetical protein B0H99_103174 [Planomicrobium soli]